MTNTANEARFARRIKQIETQCIKAERRRKSRFGNSAASYLITPLMLCACLTAGIVYAWDAMDRPTETPFAMASILAEKLLSF